METITTKRLCVMYGSIILITGLVTTLVGLLFNVLVVDCVFWWQVWYFKIDGVNILLLQNVFSVVKMAGIIGIILFSIDIWSKLGDDD